MQSLCTKLPIRGLILSQSCLDLLLYITVLYLWHSTWWYTVSFATLSHRFWNSRCLWFCFLYYQRSWFFYGILFCVTIYHGTLIVFGFTVLCYHWSWYAYGKLIYYSVLSSVIVLSWYNSILFCITIGHGTLMVCWFCIAWGHDTLMTFC